MLLHIKNVHKGELSICSIYGKVVRDLTCHEREVHSVNSEISCHICRKTYSTGRKLKGHIRYIHSDEERNHVCEMCSSAFKFKRLLRNHYIIHSNKKNFKCDIRHETFKLQNVLYS